MTNEPTLLSRAEAAELIGVSTRTINRYAAAGYLKPVYTRVRGQLVPRYSRTEVEWLDRRRTAAESLVPEEVCR